MPDGQTGPRKRSGHLALDDTGSRGDVIVLGELGDLAAQHAAPRLLLRRVLAEVGEDHLVEAALGDEVLAEKARARALAGGGCCAGWAARPRAADDARGGSHDDAGRETTTAARGTAADAAGGAAAWGPAQRCGGGGCCRGGSLPSAGGRDRRHHRRSASLAECHRRGRLIVNCRNHSSWPVRVERVAVWLPARRLPAACAGSRSRWTARRPARWLALDQRTRPRHRRCAGCCSAPSGRRCRAGPASRTRAVAVGRTRVAGRRGAPVCAAAGLPPAPVGTPVFARDAALRDRLQLRLITNTTRSSRRRAGLRALSDALCCACIKD